jgi:NTP pyrophosphatase (non-canonical NTP hydrolase)
MIKHSELVAALAKPGQAILNEQSPLDAHLQHMAIGVAGEAGELLDAIKKKTIYQGPLDVANVIEELGDLEFYLEGIRAALGITREITIVGNITKLSKRYQSPQWHQSLQYSNQQAQARADKIDPAEAVNTLTQGGN